MPCSVARHTLSTLSVRCTCRISRLKVFTSFLLLTFEFQQNSGHSAASPARLKARLFSRTTHYIHIWFSAAPVKTDTTTESDRRSDSSIHFAMKNQGHSILFETRTLNSCSFKQMALSKSTQDANRDLRSTLSIASRVWPRTR